MIRNIFRVGVCICVAALGGVSTPARAQTPAAGEARALAIAQKLPSVSRIAAELKREASRIKDPKLRKDALEILIKPRFTVIQARASEEPAIQAALRKAGLLAEGAPLFPPHEPMDFIATPGSPWRGHHSYPGGLARHELVNLKSALALGETYRDVYGVRLDEDLLRAAPIWHDCAKTITIAWNADGTTNSDEGTIAGTGAHHILGLAEALYRGYPAKFIVTLGAAHNPPIAGAGLESLLMYLKAAALIAGKPFSAAGLSDDGSRLATDPPIEAFIHHLSDHDWVLTQVSLTKVVGALEGESPSASPRDYWAENEILAKTGDLYLYEQLLLQGPAAIHDLLSEPHP